MKTASGALPTVWSEHGYAALSGDMLKLYQALDQVFLQLANEFAAVEYQFPNLICSHDLEKINYFESFGHLATTVLQGSETLTPAACYHFYSALKGKRITVPKYLTTRANCFRREEKYEPLRRQWCFGMREIVCIGERKDVVSHLTYYRERLTHIFRKLALPVDFNVATDPFFNPENNPKYIMQKIDPVKHEMVFDNDIAIGSINDHRTTFGAAFDIRINGEPANSACVAFGLERWIWALHEIHGERALPVIQEYLKNGS